MQKTLYILRHAKAESGSGATGDHERGLIERGLRDAEAMGRYMAKAGIRPDKILCSTARRATETLAQLQTGYGAALPDERTGALYLASANAMLNLIAATEESVEKLMIVGHNPGLHQLAAKLAATGDEAQLDALSLKFPTCTLAAISFDVSWTAVPRAPGRLEILVMPEMLVRGKDI